MGGLWLLGGDGSSPLRQWGIKDIEGIGEDKGAGFGSGSGRREWGWILPRGILSGWGLILWNSPFITIDFSILTSQ